MFKRDSSTGSELSKAARILNFLGLQQSMNAGESDKSGCPIGECSHDRCESGGYNEAFVLQNWANYGPYH